MLIGELLTKIIIIFSGLLVKYNPNLIAGCNTLSNKEKEKVDIKKLSLLMRNYLICIGALFIIIGILLYFLEIEQSFRLLIFCFVLIIGLIIMVFKGQKYYNT